MTMTTATPQCSSTVDTSLAADRLGVLSVLGYVLSGIAPLTVAAGLITVAFAVTGITGIPFTLAVVAVLLGLFAVGFLSMARHVSNAGAFYSYVMRGLGRSWGVGAAMMAFGAYNCLQVALYGAFGVTAGKMFADTFHTDRPWWFWALLAWGAVAVLGLLDVKWVSLLLGVLIAAETAVILALSVGGLSHPASGADVATALSPSGLTLSTGSVAGAVAVLCFVGFELAPVYREEARHATRTIITATGVALLAMLLTYGLAAGALIVHYGPDRVVGVARELGPEMLFRLGGDGWLATTGRWLFLSSLFAAMTAFHNAVARYTFVLGRERVLPKPLERINRAGAPWLASALQSLLGLAAIVVFAVEGWDPMVRMFFWLGQTGGFLVLGLLALTSVAVVTFFRREPGRLVLPAIAGAGLLFLFVEVWRNYSVLLGEATPSLASRLLPALSVLLLLVGLLRAAWLRKAGR